MKWTEFGDKVTVLEHLIFAEYTGRASGRLKYGASPQGELTSRLAVLMEIELASIKSRPMRKLCCILSHTTKVKVVFMPATERGSFIIPRVEIGVLVKDVRLRLQGRIRCDKSLSCTKLWDTILTQLPESKN